jgi:alkylation response protein AidB-like acyl-CoA dehydrogenase
MTEIQQIQFSEEQAQLLEIAGTYCRDKSPIAEVRARIETEQGHDPAIYTEIAALGWLGIAVPEEYGGSGLGLGEVVAIAEPMGRHLLATPFLSTTVAAQALLAAGTDTQKAAWLPRLCEGTVATMALTEPDGDWHPADPSCRAERVGDSLALAGTKSFVADAETAEVIIASVALDGAPSLVLIETSSLPEAALQRETAIDETRRSCRLSLDGLIVPADNLLDPARAEAALHHVQMVHCLLLAAEMCGGIAGVLDVTLEYLNTRKQFDHYIGSYQALKHPMVDVLTGLEASRSLLYHAATKFGSGAAGEIAVRMAKAQASDAFAFASDRAIQFHGGFGFTYDCDAQLFRRRALWCEYQQGDAAYHRRHLAELLL